jgi:predicted RNase H-like HicB family nuclease
VSVPKPSTAPVWVTLDLWARFDKTLGRWVAGSSELDVWSSGSTPQESVERASEAIALFLDEATEMGTVWEILKRARIELHEGAKPPPVSSSIFDRLRKTLAHEVYLPAVFQVPSQPPTHF